MSEAVRSMSFSETKANRMGARLFALGIPYLEEQEAEQ
jgi:hypothetical protein